MITPTARQAEIRDEQKLGLLIIAPAGCGKTEALALRTAGLLARGQVRRPSRILVTTFSNRARDNIRERLQQYLPGAAAWDCVAISNFHGLAARIFRAHASVIGMDPSMTIPDSDWVTAQCKDRRLGYTRAGEAQDILRMVKQESLDDAAVRDALATAGNRDAIEIEAQRITEHRLTYDDLLRVCELILQNEDVADLYRCLFSCVIVDEFQDLTPQQLRVIRRIGEGRTTFAGDIAQGIYGFAGAAPEAVLTEIEQEVSRRIVFADSHRSSPAVLEMVNALAPFTGGQHLRSADPALWPAGGLAGLAAFRDTAAEAAFAREFAATVLRKAPHHRIGVIARTANRRRFADAAFADSTLSWYRWDDPLLDTDTAKAMRALLTTLSPAELSIAPDMLRYLHHVSRLESVTDPDLKKSLAEALAWTSDLLQEGANPGELRARIKTGDDGTLLTTPGVHLLSGHAGKGQQFDWVVILGAEEGCIPDFRAKTEPQKAEEARVLSVMISRARHGVILTHAAAVEDSYGRPWAKEPSSFQNAFTDIISCREGQDIQRWLDATDWDLLVKADPSAPQVRASRASA
jgi:DNA helicase II / ATP-dependent DNA helicase PcrA